MKKKILFVSLGCDKNLVDSEMMLGMLLKSGYEFTDDERDILLCIQRRSLTADDIAESAQIPARRVLSALTMLQLRGMAEEKPGKRFYASVILTP